MDHIPVEIDILKIIILNFFLNSSNTSSAFTGLSFEERFALGMARGKFENLSIDFITLWFGNLIATVFNLAKARDDIFDFLFFQPLYK